MKKLFLITLSILFLTSCNKSINNAPIEVKNSESTNTNQESQEEVVTEHVVETAHTTPDVDIKVEQDDDQDLPLEEYLNEMEFGYIDTLHHLLGEYYLLLEEFQFGDITYEVYKENVTLNLQSLTSLIEELENIRPSENNELILHHEQLISLLQSNLGIRNLALEALGTHEEEYDQDLLLFYVKPKIKDIETELEAWFVTFWDLSEQ